MDGLALWSPLFPEERNPYRDLNRVCTMLVWFTDSSASLSVSVRFFLFVCVFILFGNCNHLASF